MKLSVKDAAQLLSVSEKTIYRWIKLGVVPAYKISGCYRFSRAELMDWATSRRLGLTNVNCSDPEDDNQSLPSLCEALENGGVFYRIEGQTSATVLENVVSHLRLPEEVDRNYLLESLHAREELASTAIGNGIAIPHPRNPGLLNVLRSTVTLCFLEQPVEFYSLDGQPVTTLLLIIAPNLRAHLHLLSRLGFALQSPAFRQVLNDVESREKIFAALTAAEKDIKS